MKSKVLTTVVLFLVSSLGLAASKLAPDLEGVDPSEKIDVIIQFVAPPTPADIAEVTSHGATKKRTLPAIDGA